MVYTGEEKSLDVAMEAGRQVMVHAEGSPAQIVAVGVAAAVTVLAVGVGYGLYKGGEKLLDYVWS